MKKVQVLLRENVDNLGRCGDVVNVAAGFARNYLVPRNMVVPATPENVKTMQRRKARLGAEDEAILADVKARIEALNALTLFTSGRADENGQLFGSVSGGAVARLLSERGFETEEHNVRLDQPIRTTGSHDVTIHVHGDHSAVVKVEVAAEA